MAMKPQNLYTTIYQKETCHKRTDNKNSVWTCLAPCIVQKRLTKETKPYTNSIMTLPTRTIE